MIEESEKSVFARIVPGMSSRCSQPPAEEQTSVCAKQECVAGRFCAEATRFHAIVIKDDFHAGNGFSAAPKTRLLPIAAGLFRFHEEDIRRHFSLKTRHNLRQLTDAGGRAGAMGMCQHHQGRTVRRSFNLSRRPLRRESPHPTGRVLVLKQDPTTKCHRRDPDDREQCCA